MTTLQTYCGLFAITTLYAVLLSRIPQIEPDLTFLEVIVGVAMCLYAAYFDRIWNGPMTSEVYEARVWLAFKVGGAPIIIWQLYKLIRAWRRITERIISRIYGNTTDQAAPLASQRRSHQETDD